MKDTFAITFCEQFRQAIQDKINAYQLEHLDLSQTERACLTELETKVLTRRKGVGLRNDLGVLIDKYYPAAWKYIYNLACVLREVRNQPEHSQLALERGDERRDLPTEKELKAEMIVQRKTIHAQVLQLQELEQTSATQMDKLKTANRTIGQLEDKIAAQAQTHQIQMGLLFTGRSDAPQISRLIAENRRLRESNAAMQTQISDMTGENITLREQITSMHTQNTALQEQLNHIAHSISRSPSNAALQRPSSYSADNPNRFLPAPIPIPQARRLQPHDDQVIGVRPPG